MFANFLRAEGLNTMWHCVPIKDGPAIDIGFNKMRTLQKETEECNISQWFLLNSMAEIIAIILEPVPYAR